MPIVAIYTFLPFALVIGVWVAWSDMKFMKIPNTSVMALWLVWAVVGGGLVLAGILPWQSWAWGFALAAGILALGFVLNAAGALGAGDAKFASAMAPFFVHADLAKVFIFFASCLLGAFAVHRFARALPFVRNATSDWVSWTEKKFPMGLALAGTLILYLLAPLMPLS